MSLSSIWAAAEVASTVAKVAATAPDRTNFLTDMRNLP
jgi:hypothetical protein